MKSYENVYMRAYVCICIDERPPSPTLHPFPFRSPPNRSINSTTHNATPDAAPLASFKVADRAVVHCVLSERPPGARAGGPHIGMYAVFACFVLLFFVFSKVD